MFMSPTKIKISSTLFFSNFPINSNSFWLSGTLRTQDLDITRNNSILFFLCLYWSDWKFYNLFSSSLIVFDIYNLLWLKLNKILTWIIFLLFFNFYLFLLKLVFTPEMFHVFSLLQTLRRILYYLLIGFYDSSFKIFPQEGWIGSSLVSILV